MEVEKCVEMPNCLLAWRDLIMKIIPWSYFQREFGRVIRSSVVFRYAHPHLPPEIFSDPICRCKLSAPKWRFARPSSPFTELLRWPQSHPWSACSDPWRSVRTAGASFRNSLSLNSRQSARSEPHGSPLWWWISGSILSQWCLVAEVIKKKTITVNRGTKARALVPRCELRRPV